MSPPLGQHPATQARQTEAGQFFRAPYLALTLKPSAWCAGPVLLQPLSYPQGIRLKGTPLSESRYAKSTTVAI
jgi:hypothetical protein